MRNRADTLAYLRMLAGERADGRYIEIRSRPAGQTWMRRTAIPAVELDRAARLIIRLGVDRDVFVGVALRTRPDAGGRDAIDRCHLAFVEIDTAEGARRLEEFRYPPTARVGSGTEKHVHAYWRLTRPVAGEELEAANRKLAAHLAGDPASIDVARLLRPPGSMNQKHRPARPVTRLAARPHTRYDLEQLVEALRDPAPRRRAGRRAWRPVNALDARLRAIPAAEFVRVLAGLEADRGGKVRCPFHDPDRTPSLQLYDDGSWYCFGCRRGGSIYQFAALLWNVAHTRRSPIELRRALAEVFFPCNRQCAVR